MFTTYELNNQRKDANFITNAKLNKHSPVVEVFSAMVNGKPVGEVCAQADKAVEYIKSLGARAGANDYAAMAELNSIRRFVIEEPVMQEIKLLGIFGSYQNVGYDETIEREVYKHSGERSRIQAAGGDVVSPVITKERYTVPDFTVSGGYAVDYRRVELGDMTQENIGMQQVKTDILNRALLSIVQKVYDAITNATGVKYTFSAAGLTKTGVDGVLSKVRRFGKPTIIGDYSMVSQLIPWAGYVGTIDSNTITGISRDIMNEIAQTGMISMYNGAIVSEMPNPYDLYNLNADGSDFKTLLPADIGFVIPQGARSPIATWSRGGLTSFTGNNVTTGQVETRFDLNVAVDVAKGQEYMIGIINDTNLA